MLKFELENTPSFLLKFDAFGQILEQTMRTTMADVAQRAGTSVSTVSLVLNDRPGVSAEVRAAVLAAAEELGYRLPQRRAPGRAAQRRTITVVHFADPVPSYRGEVGYLFTKYLDGIRDYCQPQNINWAFIANYGEGDDRPLGYHLLADKALPRDGLILIGLSRSQDSWLLRRIAEENIPTVVLSRNWPDLPISTVSQDHFEQARIALDYLIELGHKKIAFLAGERDRHYDWFEWRLACYRQAMAELNGELEEELIVVAADGCEAAKQLMSRRSDVTAIWAIYDDRAIEVMCGLSELGLGVPDDVSVIGLDDTCTSPDGCPGLTTVGFSGKKLGSLAAELLMKQIEDDQFRYGHIVVGSYLVERDSCARPRCLDDGHLADEIALAP
jgi:DNA-binding LacI/PurR family transcriptional regulator